MHNLNPDALKSGPQTGAAWEAAVDAFLYFEHFVSLQQFVSYKPAFVHKWWTKHKQVKNTDQLFVASPPSDSKQLQHVYSHPQSCLSAIPPQKRLRALRLQLVMIIFFNSIDLLCPRGLLTGGEPVHVFVSSASEQTKSTTSSCSPKWWRIRDSLKRQRIIMIR